MKKSVIAITVLATVFVMGTAAYAAVDDSGFGQMLPWMKQMHPSMNENELEQMYNDCHGRNGERTRGMMQNDIPAEWR
ncbi:hypothetical protein [Paenibacillus sp. OSY-SE]|uniref:hypothetical protein n=1 Tax=Paenibacillus sp. OSY-SE TaxID=1196323 RepID=UPI0002F1A981|nr:hypothetical protein [Paenibacillus sp. OSY-SE]